MMFNKKISLLLVGAMGIVFLITGSAYADCPAGMVSYWNLDETSGDKYADVFDGNDGTGNNNPTATAGRVNGGQQFAAGTGIDVPPDNAFNWAEDDSFSIEFWIKRNGAPGAAQVAIGRDAGNPGTSLHWWVGIDAGDNVITFSLGDNDGGSITDVVGATSITNDAWHHVVAVRNSSLGADGQNLLYIDGNLDTAAVDADYDAGFDSATAELNIGRLDLAPGYQFVGGLDEVALYNRALSQSEIQTHYTNGVAGQGYCSAGGRDYSPYPDDLISYWDLDESTPSGPGETYEDVFDENDGTGNANPAPTTGRVNGGQEFGAGTGIDVPPDNSFNWHEDDSFSIEFWIKRNGAPGAAQVAVGRDAGNPGTSLHWWVGIDAGDNVITFSLGDNDGGSITDVVGATSITNDAWHHVVAVRNSSLGADGQNLLYIDGNLDTAAVDADYDAGFDSATAELNIGRLDLAPGYQFVGGLDEVALYNRALPQSEIQTHYSNGLSGRGIDYVAPGGGGGSRGGGGGGGGGCFIAIMAE